jgi:ATP-binding cassette subfamily B protein
MRTFDSVIPLLKQSWGKLTIGLFVLIVVDIIQMYIPLVIQRTVDSFDSGNFTRDDIILPALLIVIFSLAIVGMRYLWRMLFIGNSYVMEKVLRKRFYNHLMKLSQNYFNFSKIGDLMALATNDLNAVRMLFGIGLIAGADIFFMGAIAFYFMITIDLQLTLLALIPMPLLSFMIAYFGRRLHKRFSVVQASFARLSGMIQESITGIRVVKAFAQEDAELGKMQGFSEDFVKENVKMAKVSGLFHPSLGVIISISMIIVLVYGGRSVIEGKITIGSFIAFFSYLGMMAWPMIAIGWVVDLYQRGTASLKRLNAVWETEPEIKDHADTDHSITQISGSLTINNLSFGYNPQSEPIFTDISTSINTGETLSITGRTGVGKTTFVDLLCRVYEPPIGSVLIDGHEIHRIPISLLRGSIVMVPQDIFLFSDTVANNIALGRPDADISEIEAAARNAAVYDDIMGFEKGFDTVIGERGVTVSGGQKQRIAIARALLTDPKILILDDALSAVDTKTEREILKNLVEFRKNKTNIIIAHRISALAHAQKIVVIEHGKIIETGSHDELVAIGGVYNELYEKQKIQARLEQ